MRSLGSQAQGRMPGSEESAHPGVSDDIIPNAEQRTRYRSTPTGTVQVIAGLCTTAMVMIVGGVRGRQELSRVNRGLL